MTTHIHIKVSGSPSSLCFNAVFLLLDIPEQLKSFREAIDALFTTIAPYLGIFRIYDKMEQFNDIEPELKRAIHAVMISFVDVCALAIRLRDSGKWQKFKSSMKVAILRDDSGIKAEIEKFESLTKTHHSVQSTQTLKVLLETRSDLIAFLEKDSERNQQIATDVASLKASDDNRKSKDNRRKHIDNIMKKLGIEDSVYKSFMETCDKPRKDCISNTAGWFTNLPNFKNWAERDNCESDMLFMVTGSSHTGKTVVLSNMIHHLRSLHEASTLSSPRTLIAAYFFPSVTVKDDRDKRPISTALKCIAIQLAHLDAAYAESFSQSCDSKSENINFFKDADCQELWDFLEIGSPRGNTTLYLIFDGLSGLPDESPDTRAQKEQLFRILCNSVQSSVRVLISVRRDMFRTEDLPPHSNVEIEKHNEQDIKKYIDQFMNDNDLFQDAEDQALSTRVSDSLTERVRGNYNKLKAALGQIKDVVASDGLVTEINKILADSSMTEKQITQATIAQLEERLSGEEVDELNELLSWVIYGMRPFTIDELNAALFLRSQRRGTLRLRKKVEGKYSSILTINTGGRVGVHENIKGLLTKRRTKPRSTNNAPEFTATISITKGDFRSVQTFLWSLSQKVDSLAHDRFGFEQIPERQRVKDSIQVNEVDANFTIIRRTFHFLAGEPNKETRALGPYLLRSLPGHLDEITKKATGYEELTRAQKQEIGEGLFSLFVSGEAIERHWDSCQMLFWYGNPGEIGIFRKWLDDGSATSHLGWLDREWLKKVRADPNPNQALLLNIMKTVARHWLCERKWEAVRAFEWLKGFWKIAPPTEVNTIGALQESKEVTVNPVPSLNPQNTEILTNVLEWCKGIVSIISDEDKALMNERLGETYFAEKKLSKAIESYNYAISLASPDWESLEGLANALAGDEQYENACQTMEKALEIIINEDSPDKNSLLSANYSQLAEWQLELKQPIRAVKYLERAIGVTPEEDNFYFEILTIYLLNDLINDTVGFVRDLVMQDNVRNGVSLFGRVIDLMADDFRAGTLFGALFGALADEREMLTSAHHEIDYAIDRARINGRMDNTANLPLFKGVAIYRYGPDESTRAQQAIRCWEQSLNVELSSSYRRNLSSYFWWKYPHIISSAWLCEHYFSEARKLKNPDPQDLNPYLEKMKRIIEMEASYNMTASNMFLMSFYARASRDTEATKKVSQVHIEAAFDMLSDDINQNDWEGYTQLGSVLTHCGDDINGLYAYLIPLPELAKGPIAWWVLDFETGEEQKLSHELVTAMERNVTGRFTTDKIEFILKRIDRAISEIGDSTDGATCETTDQEYSESPNHETHFTPGDSAESTCNEQIVVSSGFIMKGSDSTTDKATRLTTNGKSERMAAKAAYERIRHRVQEWSNVPKSKGTCRCDFCHKLWNFENAMNSCKYCFNTAFCDECLKKLKAGKIKITAIDIQCNSDHDWLRLPRWNKDMYLRSLKKTVCVGGQFDIEGRPVGGTTVPVTQWLAGLKEQWGISEKQNHKESSAEDLHNSRVEVLE